jgi:dTDP-4-amino-4,6-dideoxygalactose transaminase
MLNTPFSPWPSYSEDEINAAANVLRSNKVNAWTGSLVKEFEGKFAAWCHARHAVAVANGTLALELALRALNLREGDEVVVTPRTFVASASAIVAVGAVPVFADVDLESQNITPESVARVVTGKTKAIICVHLAGWPCDMDGFKELASMNNLWLVEDCAQAHGATYKGRPVGGLGDVAAWSFCQDKIMTTGGEGGMVTTNNTALWNKMWSYKDHGKSHTTVFEKDHPPGFRWLHESFGSNYRLTEMQAAIGLLQLQKMSTWATVRRENAGALLKFFRGITSLRCPESDLEVEHAYYKFYSFIRPERIRSGWTRDRIIDEINRAGVPCYQGSCSEIYNERCFQDAGIFPECRLVNAVALGETSLMFLVHPTLTSIELEKVCSVVKRVMQDASV